MPFSAAGLATAGSVGEYGTIPSNGETMWQLSFPLEEAEAKNLSAQGPAALKREALNRCQLWHKPVPALLNSTPEIFISGYPVYDRDILEKKLFRGGKEKNLNSLVTMIGDAAHPMSPFKGKRYIANL